MLVVIGLIVGGVLVGQDLIRAAGVRATIAQIERYNTAANTFREKYGGLPGDISFNSLPANAGFLPRGSNPGEGDGNGLIEGYGFGLDGMTNCGICEGAGETTMFWRDLSNARLIDAGFNSATETVNLGGTNPSSSLYLPAAKLGGGNYIYVFSGGKLVSSSWQSTGINYYGLSVIPNMGAYWPSSTAGLSVKQAYDIDLKIDDGMPQSGNVIGATALSACGSPCIGWAGTAISGTIPYTTATPGSSTSCFDNGGNVGTQQTYFVEISNGSNVNCALSFKMQAGD